MWALQVSILTDAKGGNTLSTPIQFSFIFDIFLWLFFLFNSLLFLYFRMRQKKPEFQVPKIFQEVISWTLYYDLVKHLDDQWACAGQSSRQEHHYSSKTSIWLTDYKKEIEESMFSRTVHCDLNFTCCSVCFITD